MTAQGNSLGNSPVEGGHSDPGTAEATPVDSPAPSPAPEARAQPAGQAVDSRADEPAASTWGRVDPDGTVYVRTAEGERAVGQYPEGTPRGGAELLHAPLRRPRVRGPAAGAASPVRRAQSRRGDRVDQEGRGAARRAQRRRRHRRPQRAAGRPGSADRGAARASGARTGPVVLEESHTRKKEIVAEAEKISQGKDWRNGVNRLRDLLEEWKALPRLDKKLDDELWHRFSGARTAYTRRRKTHFAELSEKREGARVVKQRLLKEAESLSTSTEWGPTSSRYRELMQEWKAAGPAPRDIEEELWQRFRAAQDTFFGARDAANAEQDKEFAANAEKKKELLVEAEALLPVTDLDAAKRALPRHQRALGRRGQGAPRPDEVAGGAGSARWSRRSARSRTTSGSAATRRSRRAPTTCSASSSAPSPGIEADLEKARAAGDQRKIKELEENLASRQQFLEMARKAASDFS